MNKRVGQLIFVLFFLIIQSACVCDTIRIEKNYYTATTNAVEALLPANITIAINSYNDLRSSDNNFIKLTSSYILKLHDTDASKSEIGKTINKTDELSKQIIADLQLCQSSIASKNTQEIESSLSSAQNDLEQIKSTLNSLRSLLSASNPVKNEEKKDKVDIIALIDSFDSTINSQLVVTISKINNYLGDLKLRQHYDSEFNKNSCS